MNKVFCPVPWNSLNTRNNGDIRLCCQSNVSVTKEDGSSFNIAKDGTKTFRNASILKNIRMQMMNGADPIECRRCTQEENSGVNSRRMYDNETWAGKCDLESVKNFTKFDGTIELEKIQLGHADLRFGNLCNLKCRMCGPTDSSAWYEETLQVFKKTEFYISDKKYEIIKNDKNRAVLKNDSLNWQNGEMVWEFLDTEIMNLQHIFIIGGEPLLIERHYEFLEKCINLNVAKNITIEIMTNLTNVPKKAWELWKHFKKIMVCVSIDAVGDLNNYIRYPSKWGQIESNINKLASLGSNIRIIITPTIQALNIVHLPDLLLWMIGTFSHDKKIKMTLHPLHSPSYLSVKILPLQSKLWITQYFEECKSINKVKLTDTEYAYFCSELDAYSKFMNSEDKSDELLNFRKFTSAIDNFRNQSLKQISEQTFKLLYE